MSFKALDKLQNGERAFIVCIGDSITEQNYHLEGRLNYVGLLTERLMELYNRKSSVLNAGKSGDTAQGILNRLEEDALRFRPDLVTVMVGINDAVLGRDGIDPFKLNLELLVKRIAASGSEVLLLTQNGVDFHVREQSVLLRTAYPSYAAAIQEIAVRSNIPLCNIYERWGEYVQGQTNNHLMLMHDSIHPGARGHAFIAAQLYHYLGILPSDGEIQNFWRLQRTHFNTEVFITG